MCLNTSVVYQLYSLLTWSNRGLCFVVATQLSPHSCPYQLPLFLDYMSVSFLNYSFVCPSSRNFLRRVYICSVIWSLHVWEINHIYFPILLNFPFCYNILNFPKLWAFLIVFALIFVFEQHAVLVSWIQHLLCNLALSIVCI